MEEPNTGRDGFVFPMTVRGGVIGVIVCGNREGEKFAPDERPTYANVAHEVATALVALRARENYHFVLQLAGGEISTQEAEERAQTLVKSLTSSG